MTNFSYIIGLGSNLEPRFENLHSALEKLKTLGTVIETAPLFENPPLLPAQAPESWYHFFLNTIISLTSQYSPEELLLKIKQIEQDLGRPSDHPSWSPRTIDIDIIFCEQLSNQLQLHSPALQIPHSQWKHRPFVVSPLFHMTQLPSVVHRDVSQQHRLQKHKLTSLMATVNVTPDSFSRSSHDLEPHTQILKSLQLGVGYIDIGAESTRPGATPLSAKEEMERLQPLFECVPAWKKQFPFTRFSIDTYHPETAEKASDCQFDILNDVQGLQNPRMQEVAKNFPSVILMHSLSVPASADITLPTGTPVLKYLEHWLEQKLKTLSLPTENLIFDPGIGFGLSPLQSLEVIQNIRSLCTTPLRVLVGHSRKSFMRLWTDKPAPERDPETMATSLHLLQSGVDILRVHEIELHQRTLKAFYATHSS